MLPLTGLTPADRGPAERDCTLEPLTLGRKTGTTGRGVSAAVEAKGAAILLSVGGVLAKVGGQGPTPRLDATQSSLDLSLRSGASGKVSVHQQQEALPRQAWLVSCKVGSCHAISSCILT